VERLVTWNEWHLRVAGSRIQDMARAAIAQRRAPLQDLILDFREGELLISGRTIKFVPVPFQAAVRRIEVDGLSVRVLFEDASAFGFIPMPRILLSLFGDQRVADGITVHPESLSVSVALDRFLPPFVELTIESISLVSGGIRVRCGSGGADPPAELMEKLH
jgi:hypothetical protein